MDTRQFDMVTRQLSLAGTRRRALAALAVGGLGLGAVHLTEVDARKKRKHKNKKKRCKNLGQPCKQGGKRKCCGDLLCQVRAGNSAADCCLGLGSPCEAAEDCCEGACIPPLIGTGGKTCRPVT